MASNSVLTRLAKAARLVAGLAKAVEAAAKPKAPRKKKSDAAPAAKPVK